MPKELSFHLNMDAMSDQQKSLISCLEDATSRGLLGIVMATCLDGKKRVFLVSCELSADSNIELKNLAVIMDEDTDALIPLDPGASIQGKIPPNALAILTGSLRDSLPS